MTLGQHGVRAWRRALVASTTAACLVGLASFATADGDAPAGFGDELRQIAPWAQEALPRATWSWADEEQ